MRIRCKFLVMAVILVIILPTVLAGILQDTSTANNTNAGETTAATQCTIAEPLSISVLMQNGIVQKMLLNNYLIGVVLCEMPATFNLEALKAQAVVARTYVLRRDLIGGKHETAVVCVDSDCCQGYYDPEEYLKTGGTEDALTKVKKAVNMTNDLVLLYNGELIDATYFSCSGGMTEDALSVWGEDIPYLQSIESLGEEKAKHYVDTVSFRVNDFLQLLEIKGNMSVEIRDITYTNGGGVDSIAVCGKRFKGTEFRKKLGLRSTAFAISVVGDTVIITTKGFGHRVGMSQYGADAMADGGAGFQEILTHYYQGAQLATYNSN